MNKKISLIIIASLITFVSFGQITYKFIEDYPTSEFPNGIPFCVDYSHEEQVDFGAIYTTDTIDGELTDTYEANAIYEKNGNKILTKDYVMQHLLPATKFIYSIDSNSKDTLLTIPIDDYLSADFYSGHSVYKGTKFVAVTYERIFVNGIRSSEKYLCTFSNGGTFISRIIIASFIFNGTGYSTSGARVPWFSLEHGCVNKDLTINFISQIHGDKKYKIQNDGQIVEIK